MCRQLASAVAIFLSTIAFASAPARAQFNPFASGSEKAVSNPFDPDSSQSDNPFAQALAVTTCGYTPCPAGYQGLFCRPIHLNWKEGKSDDVKFEQSICIVDAPGGTILTHGDLVMFVRPVTVTNGNSVLINFEDCSITLQSGRVNKTYTTFGAWGPYSAGKDKSDFDVVEAILPQVEREAWHAPFDAAVDATCRVSLDATVAKRQCPPGTHAEIAGICLPDDPCEMFQC